MPWHTCTHLCIQYTNVYMHIVFHTYNYLYSANHIHNPFDVYTGASCFGRQASQIHCSEKVFFFFLFHFLCFFHKKKTQQRIKKKKTDLVIKCICGAPVPAVHIRKNMKPIPPCKCIPLYRACVRACVARVHFQFFACRHVYWMSQVEKKK